MARTAAHDQASRDKQEIAVESEARSEVMVSGALALGHESATSKHRKFFLGLIIITSTWPGPKSRSGVHQAGQCWGRGRLVRIRSDAHYSRYRRATSVFRASLSADGTSERSQQSIVSCNTGCSQPKTCWAKRLDFDCHQSWNTAQHNTN